MFGICSCPEDQTCPNCQVDYFNPVFLPRAESNPLDIFKWNSEKETYDKRVCGCGVRTYGSGIHSDYCDFAGQLEVTNNESKT